MELHSPINSVAAKRLWNFLRITFFMMRKGLISKRKLIMDMNLMMKRGKVLGRTLGNLMFHHRHHPRSTAAPRGFGLQDYEFSCSNSPNPVFFHAGRRRHGHHYFPSITHFPCINAQEDPDELEEPRPVIVLPKIEYSPDCSFNLRSADASDFAAGERITPMVSPLSVRVSNYSSEEENDGSCRHQVDSEAEEFIRSFYEQLRVQRRTALLAYQETQYQEMLARGTG